MDDMSKKLARKLADELLDQPAKKPERPTPNLFDEPPNRILSREEYRAKYGNTFGETPRRTHTKFVDTTPYRRVLERLAGLRPHLTKEELDPKLLELLAAYLLQIQDLALEELDLEINKGDRKEIQAIILMALRSATRRGQPLPPIKGASHADKARG